MPEGDTVFRTAQRLDRALTGGVLLEGRLDVPRHATADLAGAEVLGTVPRGKHLLTRLRLDGDALTLHTHLRMDGVWLVGPAGAPPRAPRHEVRATLRTSDVVAVGRLLGEVDLVRTADEGSLVGHLGPDLLAVDFDRDEALRRLGLDAARTVFEALHDQRAVAGLGNELVNEILFLRGLDPATPVGSVDLPALLDLSRRVIRANATRAVRSTTGDLRAGRTAYVYDRGGRPCRRCGTRIRTGEQGTPPRTRLTWHCPTCQPPPPASRRSPSYA